MVVRAGFLEEVRFLHLILRTRGINQIGSVGGWIRVLFPAGDTTCMLMTHLPPFTRAGHTVNSKSTG